MTTGSVFTSLLQVGGKVLCRTHKRYRWWAYFDSLFLQLVAKTTWVVMSANLVCRKTFCESYQLLRFDTYRCSQISGLFTALPILWSGYNTWLRVYPPLEPTSASHTPWFRQALPYLQLICIWLLSSLVEDGHLILDLCERRNVVWKSKTPI